MASDPRSEAIQASWDALWQAYAAQGPADGVRWTTPGQQAVLADLVARWLETDDPQFIDQALLFCEHERLPVLPALLSYVGASVRKRRELKPAAKVFNETTKGRAFNIMANLIARGVTIERAGEVAAVWTADKGLKPLTAGYLARQFAADGWQSQADAIRDSIALWADPETEAAWVAVERECRPITDSEKGWRT